MHAHMSTMSDNAAPAIQEARKIADAILAGDVGGACNRVQVVLESVHVGSHTLAALVERIQTGMTRTSWADIYSERQRDIREAVRGDIGKIRSKYSVERFRVLATEDAPPDVERFRKSVARSFSRVLSMYNEFASRAAGVNEALRSDNFALPQDDALVTTLASFVDSIHESAGTVATDGATLLASAADVPTLARAHDIMADAVEDYAICVRFAEKLVSPIGGPE